ncbi:beta-galactosidase trimerization domain-containing protein, partial [Acinetobacter baumannii]
HFQGIDFEYAHFAFDYYSTLRSLGLDVDIVPLNADLQGYAMIVVPPLPIVPDDLPGRIADSGGQVVFGPRSGSKTKSLQIPSTL